MQTDRNLTSCAAAAQKKFEYKMRKVAVAWMKSSCHSLLCKFVFYRNINCVCMYFLVLTINCCSFFLCLFVKNFQFRSFSFSLVSRWLWCDMILSWDEQKLDIENLPKIQYYFIPHQITECRVNSLKSVSSFLFFYTYI